MTLNRAVTIAKKTASRSDLHKKHGAVLLEGDKILAISRNLRLWGKYRSIHAEEAVLQKIPRGCKVENLYLVSIRVNNFGELRQAKPCINCQRVINRLGIRVIYSDRNGNLVWQS